MCELVMYDLVNHDGDLQPVANDELFAILRILIMHVAVEILVKLVAHMALDELVLHQLSDIFSLAFVRLDAFVDEIFDLV